MKKMLVVDGGGEKTNEAFVYFTSVKILYYILRTKYFFLNFYSADYIIYNTREV